MVTAGGSSQATGDDGLHFGTDLIARVATFASVSDTELMNICLAAGPTASNAIRLAYLENNDEYLRCALRCYIAGGGKNETKCRDDFRAWMAVNADWKGLCTRDGMGALQVVSFKSGECPDRGTERSYRVHPHVPFNNPAVAIEFGLIDVLKFLVEDKKIDVNATCWTNYSLGDERSHLASVALREDSIEAFRYLLWVDATDLSGLVGNDTSSDLTVCRLAFSPCRDRLPYFRAIVDCPSFDVNEPTIVLPSVDRTITPLQYFMFLFAFATEGGEDALERREAIYERVQILLDNGANPFKETTLSEPADIAALEYEKEAETIHEKAAMWMKILLMIFAAESRFDKTFN